MLENLSWALASHFILSVASANITLQVQNWLTVAAVVHHLSSTICAFVINPSSTWDSFIINIVISSIERSIEI